MIETAKNTSEKRWANLSTPVLILSGSRSMSARKSQLIPFHIMATHMMRKAAVKKAIITPAIVRSSVVIII
jgi:hypothetical protein